jgi:bifunctional NMN adenylyltransferase/nudix hydrolase
MNGKTIGVVVGRFQTPSLHEGHRHVIDTAKDEGRKLLIVVGSSEAVRCTVNPLDFETRAKMLESAYPEATVIKMNDNPSDALWSKGLDACIEKMFPDHEVILFGSRDSFIPYYEGKHPCRNVEPKGDHCATKIRNEHYQPLDSVEFRAGMLYAARQFFPTSFQTVDVVIKHSVENKVLVGRKKHETGWRFIGGFVDPADDSLECAAKREVLEEAGDVEIAEMNYIASIRVKDYRYRKSDHKIMTALFSAIYVFGPIKAGDDLEEVRWQDIDGLIDCLVETHKPLGRVYLGHCAQQKEMEKV